MSTGIPDYITVEVVYATPESQPVIRLELENGTTVADAISQSGLLERFPSIDLSISKLGIYGKACGLDQQLSDHDRVEIYRPLLADPKEVRRRLAAEGKTMGKKR